MRLAAIVLTVIWSVTITGAPVSGNQDGKIEAEAINATKDINTPDGTEMGYPAGRQGVSIVNGNQSGTAGIVKAAGKELYIPAKVSRVPDGNDYSNDESEYSYKRMVQTDNIAIFWHKEFGLDPLTDPAEERRFDVKAMLSECERIYNYYIDVMKFAEKGKSLTDKYKLLVFVIGGDSGTAFGGGADEKVGIFWTPVSRIRKAPYAVMAHEMVHSFQYISRIDAGTGPRGAISEMAAQYYLFNVYPEWMTFENYHLVDFMKKTHFAFLHQTNMYHSPYVLEYWSYKRGLEYYGKLSRDTRPDEDPVMTYKRMYSLTQEQFNDEMFDACRRFITWDIPRIEKVAAPYANQHHTTLIANGDGWYRIAPENCVQNYGYNGIRLTVPEGGTRIKLQFKGIAGTEGYSKVKTDKAGWRYGFVAHLSNGKRVYSEIMGDAEGEAQFKVPKKTKHLWLVVSGAPTEHWPIPARRGATAGETQDEQWPYQIKLTGTAPDASVVKK